MLSFLMFYKRIAYISVVGNHREYQGFRGYQRDLGDHGGLVVLCVQVVLDDLLALEGNAFVKDKMKNKCEKTSENQSGTIVSKFKLNEKEN